jgi:hypothetical protein
MFSKLPSLIVVAVVLLAASARAQEVMLPDPIPQRGPGGDEGAPEVVLDLDREIDLANVVTSAAKGATTVQEAPAIITIITADEIKARGFKWIDEALATVPGWSDSMVVGDQVPGPLVRGVTEAAMLMHDGISILSARVADGRNLRRVVSA